VPQTVEARLTDDTDLGVEWFTYLRPGAPHRLTAVEGNWQSAAPFTPLRGLVVVKLEDRFGNGVPAKTLQWTFRKGRAYWISSTDWRGEAPAAWTLASAGLHTASVRVPGTAVVPLELSAVAVPAPSPSPSATPLPTPALSMAETSPPREAPPQVRRTAGTFHRTATPIATPGATPSPTPTTAPAPVPVRSLSPKPELEPFAGHRHGVATSWRAGDAAMPRETMTTVAQAPRVDMRPGVETFGSRWEGSLRPSTQGELIHEQVTGDLSPRPEQALSVSLELDALPFVETLTGLELDLADVEQAWPGGFEAQLTLTEYDLGDGAPRERSYDLTDLLHNGAGLYRLPAPRGGGDAVVGSLVHLLVYPQVDVPDQPTDVTIGASSAFEATVDMWLERQLLQAWIQYELMGSPETPTRFAAEYVKLRMDALGFLPVVGEPADLASGVISLLQGEHEEAAWALPSAVPLLGWLAGGRKIGKRIDGVRRDLPTDSGSYQRALDGVRGGHRAVRRTVTATWARLKGLVRERFGRNPPPVPEPRRNLQTSTGGDLGIPWGPIDGSGMAPADRDRLADLISNGGSRLRPIGELLRQGEVRVVFDDLGENLGEFSYEDGVAVARLDYDALAKGPAGDTISTIVHEVAHYLEDSRGMFNVRTRGQLERMALQREADVQRELQRLRIPTRIETPLTREAIEEFVNTHYDDVKDLVLPIPGSPFNN
jgi:hypothetical protein